MKKPVIFHPLLWAVFPVLFLFQANPALFTSDVVLRPMAASLAVVLAAWGLAGGVLKNKIKAALITSWGVLTAFSYGVLYVFLAGFEKHIGSLTVDAQGLALLISAGAFLLGAAWCARTSRPLTYLTAVANVSALVLCLMSVFHLGKYKFQQRSALDSRIAHQAPPPEAPRDPDATLPNVYFIILDAYGRSDVLRDVYGFDNSEFVDFLDSSGFYVASKSRSSYVQTILSVASSLNFDYVQNIVGEYDAPVNDRFPLIEAIRHNGLANHLRNAGYSTVGFSTGVFATEAADVDRQLGKPWFLNEFETAFLTMTPLPAVLSQVGWAELYEMHRQRIRFTMDHLVELSRNEGPQFVFAHLLAPHPPFVFGERGEPVSPKRPFAIADGQDFADQAGAGREEYLEGYRAQAVFVTQSIQRVIQQILANSPRPPIILLQSDHGPGVLLHIAGTLQQNPCLRERFGILNACLLPKRDYEGFYEEISPINTVRLVLNKYFGGSYELAPDDSYFSNWDAPYKFARVTGNVGCELKLLANNP